jgi:flagellar biosynthetic protein FliR
VSLESVLLGAFVIFCRIGSCFMTLPGFASLQIPVRVRLYVAIAATLALAPLLWPAVAEAVGDASLRKIFPLLLGEILIGALMGLSARLFFLALETIATSIAMTIGLGNLFGSPVMEPDAMPVLASFALLCSTMLFFASDQHLTVIASLFSSYRALPLTGAPETGSMIQFYLRAIENSFLLSLRIGSPFLLFGVSINFAFGLVNRLVPQAPVYFVSAPILIALGLYLFAQLSSDFFGAFSSHLGSWVAKG